MDNELKTKSLKVRDRAWKQFEDTATKRDISKSRLFSNMVYSSCCIDRQDTANKVVDLMDCICALEEECDTKRYERLRKAGERLCQSLLIK